MVSFISERAKKSRGAFGGFLRGGGGSFRDPLGGDGPPVFMYGLFNTKHTSELCYQLLNIQEKQKTMVLIVPLGGQKRKIKSIKDHLGV